MKWIIYLEAAAQVFFLLWAASTVALALRVGWLRETGRAPRAPTTIRFLAGAGWTFLLGGQRKEIKDGLLNLLVLLTRALLLMLIGTMVTIYVIVYAK